MMLAALIVGSSFIVPQPGSEVRRAVLDGLRTPVERRLGPNVEFKVALIRVQRDWAFVVADPERMGGRSIDGWRIFGEHFGNMDGLRVDAILRKRGRSWIVVDHSIGATDVWYCDIGPRSLKTGWGC